MRHCGDPSREHGGHGQVHVEVARGECRRLDRENGDGRNGLTEDNDK